MFAIQTAPLLSTDKNFAKRCFVIKSVVSLTSLKCIKHNLTIFGNSLPSSSSSPAMIVVGNRATQQRHYYDIISGPRQNHSTTYKELSPPISPNIVRFEKLKWRLACLKEIWGTLRRFFKELCNYFNWGQVGYRCEIKNTHFDVILAQFQNMCNGSDMLERHGLRPTLFSDVLRCRAMFSPVEQKSKPVENIE